MKQAELLAQRQALVRRIAAQRSELARQSAPLQPPLAMLDTGCQLVRDARLRPFYLVGAAVLSVVLLRSSRPLAKKSLSALTWLYSARRVLQRRRTPNPPQRSNELNPRNAIYRNARATSITRPSTVR